jgi:hypothetical protein
VPFGPPPPPLLPPPLSLAPPPPPPGVGLAGAAPAAAGLAGAPPAAPAAAPEPQVPVIPEADSFLLVLAGLGTLGVWVRVRRARRRSD